MNSYRNIFKFIGKFIQAQKWAFLFIFLISMAWSCDGILWPYILQQVIDVFTRFEGDRFAAWRALCGPMIGAVCLAIGIEIAWRAQGFLLAKALPRLEADIRMAMFDHIQQHSPKYFNDRFTGSLANKISDMTMQVTVVFQQLIWPILPGVTMCIVSLVCLWFIHPLFSWIMFGWMALHLSACFVFAKRCDRYEVLHGEARSTLIGKMVDSLTNNFIVNLFYRFKQERNRILIFQKEEREASHRAKSYVEKMRCFLSCFYIAGIAVAVNGSIIYLWIHGKISTGQVAQVFVMGWHLAMMLWNIGGSFPVLFQSFGLIKQAYSVMCDPKDIEDLPNAPSLVISSGEIIFENVSFDHEKKALFQNTHIHIRGGEKIGLVGYTGAGKSTLINLILRFYSPKKGRIIIDGQDISQVTLKSLRRQIALIPQDPILFHRTLRENISYAKPEASEEEMKQAVKIAHCEEFINHMPGGYEAKVGERGTKLSGGEKQRVAIARAALLDAKILILDEATSSLDSVTERYIQESLDQLMHNKTALVIAHRLSTLAQMDRILVFEKGKIIEEGSPSILLAKEGPYARMWKMQTGGFLPEASFVR